MQTKLLSERIAELKEIETGATEWEGGWIATKALEIIKELQEENNELKSTANTFAADNQEYAKENQALLAKNRELEAELETRRAFIVANPCEQCGGKINAMKCAAWQKTAEEFEKDRDRYKHLWETDSAQAKEIIRGLEGKARAEEFEKQMKWQENHNG